MANPPMATGPLVSPVTSIQTKRRSPLLMLALLALNGLAGAGVWHALGRPIDTAPIKAPDARATWERSSSTDPGTLAPGPRSVADLPETTRRPLFSANRRPWVEKPKTPEPVVKVATPQPQVAAPPYPPNQFQLIGVNTGNRNFTARALIRAGNEAQGTWVQVGESIRGWKLRQVTNDSSVILETRGEQVELVTDTPALAGQIPQLRQPSR
jgi:hypothetical protein